MSHPISSIGLVRAYSHNNGLVASPCQSTYRKSLNLNKSLSDFQLVYYSYSDVILYFTFSNRASQSGQRSPPQERPHRLWRVSVCVCACEFPRTTPYFHVRTTAWCVSVVTACSVRCSTAWLVARNKRRAYVRTSRQRCYKRVRSISASSRQVGAIHEKLTPVTRSLWRFSFFSSLSLLGSTDCVCYATIGVVDPVTSALHIIIGKKTNTFSCSRFTVLIIVCPSIRRDTGRMIYIVGANTAKCISTLKLQIGNSCKRLYKTCDATI